eukprot:713382-Hanusia_phi.AAC.2
MNTDVANESAVTIAKATEKGGEGVGAAEGCRESHTAGAAGAQSAALAPHRLRLHAAGLSFVKTDEDPTPSKALRLKEMRGSNRCGDRTVGPSGGDSQLAKSSMATEERGAGKEKTEEIRCD